ncbi:MAG: hypothetical protein WAO00_00655 [Chthoniobacterales bacterium]
MEKEIPLKAWETFQGLAQSFGETCWKLRSIFYTASSAILAYAFVNSVPSLYGVVAGLSVAFFVLESGAKQIQDQYIRKSLEIERTINDILLDEEEPFISEDGISTAVTSPTLSRCFRFPLNRKFFWGPYAIMFVLSLLMLGTRLVGEKRSEFKTPVTAIFADSTVSPKGEIEWEKEWKRISDAVAELQSKRSAGPDMVTPSATAAMQISSTVTATPGSR